MIIENKHLNLEDVGPSRESFASKAQVISRPLMQCKILLVSSKGRKVRKLLLNRDRKKSPLFPCRILFFFVPLLGWLAAPPAHAQNPWTRLEDRLIQVGEDPAYVRRVFSHPAMRYNPRSMLRVLVHREEALDYGQFLRAAPLKRAHRFLQSRREILDKLERDYGVPARLIVAVFLVETNLGAYRGRSRIAQVLASMAATDRLDYISPHLPPHLAEPSQVSRLKERLLMKAQWAFGELAALLRFAKGNKLDPVAIRGSIFGAFGLCQFLPSSAELYGVDYNGDGKVDLFDEEEALASMANYLRSHGWTEEMDQKARFQALLAYNPSRPYAETVLAIMGSLKETE